VTETYSSPISVSSPFGSEHRIDPTTPEGLLDVVALGNTMELLRYLDPRFYRTHSGVVNPSETICSAESAEHDFITAQYFDFQEAFSERYAMVVNDERVNVINGLFKPSILRLAVSIVTYRKTMRSFQAGYSVTSLASAIKRHFQAHHPDLVQQYNRDIQAGQPDYLHSLDWTGSEFALESNDVQM
jgi:hypothetical protein